MRSQCERQQPRAAAEVQHVHCRRQRNLPTDVIHYRIQRSIGSGGMGEVYFAEDTKLHRNVALKVLLEDAARDPERCDRFTREARAVAALSHPNVVTIHSVEEDAGRVF
ncbi:MAG: protein kinase domain-containing protein, partial [Bacteroidales bacterium]